MNSNKKEYMTLDEWEAKMKAEGKWDDFSAKQAKRDAEFEVKAARLLQEQEPILADLQRAGCPVTSIWDLVNSSDSDPKTISVLLEHLVLPYSDRTREGLARALAVPEPEVRAAWTLLVNEYCRAPMGKGIKFPGDTEEFRLGFKEGLACTLSAIVTDETMPDYIELLRDKSHGEYRVLLLTALRKSKNPLAKQAIEELANDPDLEKEIASWRRKKK
jgi:hypothetical protein